jgi:16S rRNA (guanine966-N2)-methyltransferase
MRVIGGMARGHRLRAPGDRNVRPTADRVREAIFDVLESLNAVEDAEVLDLFAGTGALGIEALSRGARFATFVERERKVASVIEANLAATHYSAPQQSKVVCAEALSYLRGRARAVDVAFCDPPYDFEAWPELLEVLPARLCVLESNRAIDLVAPFRLHRVYRYGGTLVTVARHDLEPDKGDR